MDDARILCSGQTVTGRVDDTDWDDVYKLWVEAGQHLTISMSGTGGEADLYLYPPGTTDVNVDEPADSSTDWGNDELIEYDVSKTGYWYVDIYDYDVGDGGTDYAVATTIS